MRRIVMISAAVAAAALLAAGCSTGGGSGASTGQSGSSTSATSTIVPGTTRGTAEAVRPYSSKIYQDPKHWLCRPGAIPNVCDDDMTSTSVAADGTLTRNDFHKATDPGIDCFYVYPTTSAAPTMNSGIDADDSSNEAGEVRDQAARLGSVCRVYAPIYRQVTLAALFGKVQGDRTAASAIAYADVLDAWRSYLANDNDGRGVILIGHSQGAGHLVHLIRDEIDNNEDVRSRIVAAYLIGGSMVVPDGADVGGDFQNLPLCRKADQLSCVVAFSSFRSTAPPPANSLFGKPRDNKPGVVACVNPAALAGGPAELHSEFEHTSPVLEDAASDAKIKTPFVSLPGMLTGQCVRENGYSFLKVTVHGEPGGARVTDITGDLTPEWGLHLIDVNLVMDDLVTLAATQAKAYQR